MANHTVGIERQDRAAPETARRNGHLRVNRSKLKPVLDYGLATAAVFVLLPVLVAIALAVKLDSRGPVLFRQRRHGKDRQEFHIFKFRTMTVQEGGDSCTQAVRGDARVTRIGRLLRRSSLDELPQLFNVLAGHMSIVGPRPHPINLDQRFSPTIEGYYDRYRVKPGITGLAQIEGCRGATEVAGSMERRVAYDLDYIARWSIWLDLRIIAATPFKGFINRNAY